MTWRFKLLRRAYAHIATAALFGMLAASAALAQPEIIIRDCPSDNGLEPDNNCYAMYASEDIWIRNNYDFGTIHQSPIAGQPNYVSVRLTNNSNWPLKRGRLIAYFAKASTGLIWPSSWINNYNGPIVYGDVIGSAAVAGIGANTSTIVTIQWNNVPDPQNYNDPDARHFCLLARFVSTEDPITFTEGPSIEPNVRNNNNIAWKNVSILDRVKPRGTVDVQNATERPQRTALRFNVVDDRSRELLERVGARIRVELGEELTTRWREGGGEGEGVEFDGQALNIVAPNAGIWGLWLNPGERFAVHVEVQFDGEDPEVAGETAQWDITQIDEESDEVIGGERYDIVMPGNEDGNGKVMILPPKHNELSSKFSLSTYPNPVSSTATIKYALPADTRVTVTIFDASGRMVQEIISNIESAAGNYEAVWDGTAADGTKMPSGTYICRLSTPLGSTEQQIKITR